MEAEAADGEAAGWFFENALDAFVVVSHGKVASANPAWLALSGWSQAETLGRPYGELHHPDEAEMIAAHVVRLKRDGAAIFDHRIPAPNGDWLWVRTRAKRAADGRALLVIQDISAEHQIVENKEKLGRVAELLGETAGVYVWRFDADTCEYDLNPLDTARADDSSLLRMAEAAFKDRIHADDRDHVDELWSQVVRTGDTGMVTYRHQAESGDWRRFRTAWRGVRALPSGDWEVLGITQDVTELADARDAALGAVQAKTEFLANISHEIRTPMNGVMGVLHILKNEALSDAGQVLVDEALACGSTLAQMLSDIIDFSKIESGALELAPEALDLSREGDVVIGMLRADADARGLSLAIEAPETLGWASLDPVRLRQILFNLAGNAVKFTLQGGVRIKLATSGEGEAQRLRIEVADTGVGIPLEAQASLLDRFQQADGSSTRRFGGSGLGLAVTKALAERMGGGIGFSSIEGVGSTFWIEIAAPVCGRPAPITADRWLAGLRILVVEDNATNRMVALRMLTELGAEVEIARDGADGVEQAAASSYDLIFMDIQMPVMDGVEAARRIRSLPGQAGETPIVAMTANVLPDQIETYRRAGMDGHVAKPISPAALLAEISRLAADLAPEQAA
ncbi:PAS domain-containing hybrid sensor histidine kinase/response regulator [Phenylobacterium sp.]|uniref:PAS domain-containing hybrid sensor histidine kinase/response regulator n=3 Tax=Phenylobacterium sp. TaxID=1871053 RepID=UPI002FC969CA